MLEKRTHRLNNHPIAGKSVIYVMSRDQRVTYNFALLAAQELAIQQRLPLIVVFHLLPNVTNRLWQQYDFMLNGLKEVEKNLVKLQIPLIVTSGQTVSSFHQLAAELEPAAWFFDFSPLRGPIKLQQELAQYLTAACFVVDTHNIVPVWETSNKEEWAAYTIRPKINRLLPEYLKAPDHPVKHPHPLIKPTTDWDKIYRLVKAPKIADYNPPFIPGESAAKKQLEHFVHKVLPDYAEKRNDPTLDSQSNLSPYLHFGQISSLEAALTVNKSMSAHKSSVESFLEELIVRKELSDNFCLHNKNYDSFAGIKDWAKTSLSKHMHDKREHLYSRDEFEEAKTADPAWNAAQNQLRRTGKMHGYMRMYWAKKILEWSKTPEQAIEHAVYLNDTYHLDGYDPNGYVGILWSIGGIHDRPWFERPIFGQIRYMNYNGLKSKFPIQTYIDQWK